MDIYFRDYTDSIDLYRFDVIFTIYFHDMKMIASNHLIDHMLLTILSQK